MGIGDVQPSTAPALEPNLQGSCDPTEMTPSSEVDSGASRG